MMQGIPDGFRLFLTLLGTLFFGHRYRRSNASSV